MTEIKTKSPVKAVSYMKQVSKRFENTNKRISPKVLAKLCKAIVEHDLLIIPVAGCYGEFYTIWDTYTDLSNPKPAPRFDWRGRPEVGQEVWYEKHKLILSFDGHIFTDGHAAWKFLHPVIFSERNKELLSLAVGLRDDYKLKDSYGHYEY